MSDIFLNRVAYPDRHFATISHNPIPTVETVGYVMGIPGEQDFHIPSRPTVETVGFLHDPQSLIP